MCMQQQIFLFFLSFAQPLFMQRMRFVEVIRFVVSRRGEKKSSLKQIFDQREFAFSTCNFFLSDAWL